MTDAGDGIYTFTASVEGGTTVLWKYLNSVNFDGQESVPGACGADDGFGGFNRTLEMPIADTVLDAVCFASCEVCSDPGEEFDLVFQVDASQIDIDPAGIHIAGTFNGFSPEPMQDSGDGIYTFSALVTAGTTVLFKYTNGPTFDGVESVPAACGSDDGFGGFNRFFTMPAAPTALDIVCFSSCVACIDPGEEFALVFQVDASQIDIDPAGIHIGGSFNGFNPEPMQDGGSGIYTFTANVASGTTVLWKYTNGPTFDGAEDVPSACGITDGFGGFNRTFDMPAAPTVLDIVCFSSCEACEDPGVFFDLTFQVDASQVEIDPAGIYIAGSFNGFAPEAMTDAGNGLYTFTAAVAAGSEVLWKYLNGSEFTGAEDVPGECGEDDGFGGFNRSILMPAQNAVLSVVCFSSCVECLIGVNDATLLDAINVYPNPNTGVFNILSPVAGDAQISIYELSGRLVYNEQRHMEADQPTEINTSIAASGFYLVEMRIGEDRFITKITVM
jgi:predicted metal-binding protein